MLWENHLTSLTGQLSNEDEILMVFLFCRNLWMDVLALSGTKPTALFIKREIASGRLVGERAAQVINTLAFSMRKPDQDIIAEILDLCKSPAVMSHSSLKKACWLSFGTLAHTSCVNDLETTTSIQNTLVKTGNPHCTPEGRRRFVMVRAFSLSVTGFLPDGSLKAYLEFPAIRTI